MKRLVSTLMATLLLASYFAVPVFAQESLFNFISTMGLTVIGWQCPTFIYYSGSAYPHVIQDKRVITTTPDGYNSTLNAVKAYSDPYAVRRAYAEEVKITGIESQIASDIYPICPQFPTHIR